MSTSIDNAFIRQYEADVHYVFQREGSVLLNAVRKNLSVVGYSDTFQKIGKGTATTKARHGLITPMNQDHTAIECTLADFYAGDYVDKLDQTKTNIDEKMAIARGGAAALGRKIDDQITTVLDATTQSVVTVTVTSSGATRAGLLGMVKALYANDVRNDGRIYGALTASAWAQAMTITAFASADFVGPNGLPYTEGAPVGTWISWMGVKWTLHTGLPGAGTATAKIFVWHADAVGYAAAAAAGNVAGNSGVSADITWHGDRAAHFVNHMMSGGACMIDTTGVIEGNLDDTAGVATS
jgi:hypothetical protein